MAPDHFVGGEVGESADASRSSSIAPSAVMYQLDWIERLKSRASTPRAPVNPVVWKLGITSLLTDISSEMVSSVLPIFLTLHLHLSALQYGAIDGLYNGMAVMVLSLVGGLIADRTRRPKEVAASGYALSAGCKLLLFAAGSVWGWIAVVIAIDRTGKGIRSAPRDSIISLSSPKASLASAFALHRALDAGGAVFGPIMAFALLSLMPAAFDAIWLTSFVFAILGLAVLWLFVENPPYAASPHPSVPWRELLSRIGGRGFWSLAVVGSLLSAMTISDGFLYLLLQRRSGVSISFFPLFYVVTASCYMVFAIPLGRAADRFGRWRIFAFGYVALGLLYGLLLWPLVPGLYGSLGCLLLLGLYYGATEGVLLSMVSATVPAAHRTSGLAVLATLIGLGKMISSLLFGWLSQTRGSEWAVAILGSGLVAIAIVAIGYLRKISHDQPAP